MVAAMSRRASNPRVAGSTPARRTSFVAFPRSFSSLPVCGRLRPHTTPQDSRGQNEDSRGRPPVVTTLELGRHSPSATDAPLPTTLPGATDERSVTNPLVLGAKSRDWGGSSRDDARGSEIPRAQRPRQGVHSGPPPCANEPEENSMLLPVPFIPPPAAAGSAPPARRPRIRSTLFAPLQQLGAGP